MSKIKEQLYEKVMRAIIAENEQLAGHCEKVAKSTYDYNVKELLYAFVSYERSQAEVLKRALGE